MDEPRFCTGCGASLVAGARFCTTCGQAVAAQPLPTTTQVAPPPPAPVPTEPASAPTEPAPVPMEPAPAPAPSSIDPAPGTGPAEPVVSTISNAMLKAGFMGVGTKAYILAITDRRVIFARITNETMKQLVNDARNEAKAGGKGFMGQWGAQLSAYARYAERYNSMHPDEILAETPENFAIDRSTIVKARLKAGYDNDEGAKSSDRLIIKTTGKTYTIVLNNGIGPAKTALLAARMI